MTDQLTPNTAALVKRLKEGTHRASLGWHRKVGAEAVGVLKRQAEHIAGLTAKVIRMHDKLEDQGGEIRRLILTWTTIPPTEPGDYKIEYNNQTAYGAYCNGVFDLYRGPYSQMSVSVDACERWAGPILVPEEQEQDDE